MTPEAAPAAPRRWPVFAFPAVVSILLSAATVGAHVHWQDSSYYLVAVKEFSVLYPPGFVLYLLLCKGWTLFLGLLVDFTLAVHLFSSLCAALAAGVLALAAHRVTADRAASAVIGALAAAGYTWWYSGIYAKGYALHFLVVAFLLWRMASRDPHSVIPLLGLAWAAHPSAALLAPGVLAYLWQHRSVLRLPRLLPASAASLVCAFGPSLLLPLLAARNSPYSLAHPVTFGELLKYLSGSKFASMPGVWGFSAERWLGMGRFALEEFLLVGAVLVAAGIRTLVRERRREALLLLAWSLPILIVLPLFKIEGQYDLWLVVVWMPLWLVAAVGLSFLKSRAAWIPAAACAAGLACAAGVNGSDLYLRNETRPEALGRSFLQNLEPGAMLVVNSDDAIGLCRYMQAVRGFRSDVRVVVLSYVQPSAEQAWYLEALSRAWPEFPPPNFGSVAAHAATYSNFALAQASLINAHRPAAPPLYFDSEPAPALLQSGSVVPAGFLWKWTEKEGEAPDPRAWEYPVTLEQAAAKVGRRRGQKLGQGPDGLVVAPEAYERRLIGYLVQARLNLAGLLQRGGGAQGFAQSARIYESILQAVPDSARDPAVLYPLALDYFMLDRYAPAEELFARLLGEDPEPSQKAGALFYLGELRRMERRDEEARELFRRALEAAPAGSPIRPELEKRLAAPRKKP